MSQRCIDANVIVKLVVKGEPHRVTAHRLVNDSITAGIELIAPPMFPYEVDTILRRLVHTGHLSLTRRFMMQ